MEWNLRDEYRSEKMKDIPQKNIPIPKTFEKMKEACKILASEFPFVRMDYYGSEGKLYFGEFTFTPAALTGGIAKCRFICSYLLRSLKFLWKQLKTWSR